MSVLHQFSGACVRRVIDPSRAVVAEHAHEWPMISLYVMGGYRNVTERGEHEIAGPSMVFYGSQVAHRNVVGEMGFEQIEIEFDPQWLGTSALPAKELLLRVGGACGAQARAIAGACVTRLAEADLRNSIRRLFSIALREPGTRSSAWAGDVTARLRADPGRRIGELAREVGRSPAWIGPAYRQSSGEGLQQAAARFRVERAARLLRESDLGFADIAAEAGFCDQSHMNRTLRRLLGRSPTAIRADREAFRDARQA
ncbi:helix-turn-helix domain-containing protein [Rudaea cellulosilytica]|uniref:helix-turn-helix domain-containing protein n=1 Tax=Rudaea cellulosilytica TaxID=540746 RepID=UPI000378BF88|nr:AraC family transcriptional regulator [Rudaea cellulosilytica]